MSTAVQLDESSWFSTSAAVCDLARWIAYAHLFAMENNSKHDSHIDPLPLHSTLIIPSGFDVIVMEMKHD